MSVTSENESGIRILGTRTHGRAPAGKYVALSQLAHLPLTGLTRKILRKAELLKEGSRDT